MRRCALHDLLSFPVRTEPEHRGACLPEGQLDYLLETAEQQRIHPQLERRCES